MFFYVWSQKKTQHNTINNISLESCCIIFVKLFDQKCHLLLLILFELFPSDLAFAQCQLKILTTMSMGLVDLTYIWLMFMVNVGKYNIP